MLGVHAKWWFRISFENPTQSRFVFCWIRSLVQTLNTHVIQFNSIQWKKERRNKEHQLRLFATTVRYEIKWQRWLLASFYICWFGVGERDGEEGICPFCYNVRCFFLFVWRFVCSCECFGFFVLETATGKWINAIANNSNAFMLNMWFHMPLDIQTTYTDET